MRDETVVGRYDVDVCQKSRQKAGTRCFASNQSALFDSSLQYSVRSLAFAQDLWMVVYFERSHLLLA